jgi:prepilin-type N-terminal cleavage/methylation domain-containing protein
MREKASERKLYHSDENQTPPNLPLLRGGIDQVSPLYKGGLRGVCGSTFTLSSAFTLVELIVVITILAIL